MKTLKRIIFTKEGFGALQQKLASLKKDRPDAVKELTRAREMGDLSENGLYKAARARLTSLDNQIFRAEMELKLADVVDSPKNKSSDVQIGSKVTVFNGKSEIEYSIVGDLEANPSENKISQYSPVGRALVGLAIGQIARIKTPAKNIEYKITKIK